MVNKEDGINNIRNAVHPSLFLSLFKGEDESRPCAQGRDEGEGYN